jgi:hypothetical protein
MRASTYPLALALLASAFATPGSAAEFDPQSWLRQIYESFVIAQKSGTIPNDSSEDVVAAHASRRFKALLKRDVACEAKGQICAFDWDYFINGQAWELSNVQVGPLQRTGERGSVTATFRNFKSTNRNVYEFVREDGAWRLDDVVSGQSGRAPIRVSKVLRDFKFY